VLGLGNAAVEPDGTLEVAAVVADAWQGQGIGTRLTEAALFAAPTLAVTRVRFVVLADNRRLVSALRRGFPEGSLSYDGSSGELLAPLYLPASPAVDPADSSTSATDRRGVMAPATVP
jgi:GNAT superfamily N-acetyltransferase